MKACTYCGKENQDDAAYCTGCGQESFTAKKLTAAAVQPVKKAAIERSPSEPDPDVEPGEECLLCPACLFPNVMDVTWCKKCGGPISSTATITPLEAAQAMGSVYRGAVNGKRSLIILCGVWVLFLPGLLLNGFMFLNALTEMGKGIRAYIIAFWCLILGGICLSVLVQSTKNYRSKAARRDFPNDPDSPSSGNDIDSADRA